MMRIIACDLSVAYDCKVVGVDSIIDFDLIVAYD